ncbi:unnamed protein product [Oppiella nova]|uniref:Uncharacterized protein n=1 Tax=Oppiella nova TaxID=334625 RepID=A0A7R9LTL3_9ACAR|nr:unnamed protein product [Oppiella nova]CAG2166826.1 unnamed protein product [Oppiella nova]
MTYERSVPDDVESRHNVCNHFVRLSEESKDRDPFPINDLIKSNKDKIQTNLDDFSNSKVESKFHELKHKLNINDDYSIKLNEFKGKVFPRLWELLSTTSALMLLQLILYNDYKTQKSQLIKSALKASLVPQLVNIYETTRDIQTKQLE